MHLNLLQTARANHSCLSCVFVMVHIKFDVRILQSICYLLNLEVRPSINMFFLFFFGFLLALRWFLKWCSCTSYESKPAVSLLNAPGSRFAVGAAPVCVYVGLRMYCIRMYCIRTYGLPLAAFAGNFITPSVRGKALG